MKATVRFAFSVVPLLVAHWPLPSSLVARTCTWYVVLESRLGTVVMVVVPTGSKLWLVQSISLCLRYCMSYPVIGGMPSASGAVQLTSKAVEGLSSLVDTDKSVGAPGGSSTSVTFTVIVLGVESSVPSLAVTSTSYPLSLPSSVGFS